jgi:ribosomal protein S18 acetylase RimI-like enzyme
LSADPGWRVRPAGAGDAPALALVAAATFLNSYHAIVARDDMFAHLAANCSAARFDAWLGDPSSHIVLAETTEGATPLGYAVLTVPDLPVATGEGDIELRRIYALAAVQGSGVGYALMAEALAAARARGARRMLLGVNAGNARAQRFYEKAGFAVAGTRRFQVGQTLHDDYIYARAL